MSLFQALPVAERIGGGLYDYGCTIGVKILRWLMIALGLTLSGYLIMLPISLANNPTIRSNKITVFCWVLAATYTAIPFTLIYTWKRNGDVAPPYESQAEALVDETDFGALFVRLSFLWSFFLQTTRLFSLAIDALSMTS